MTRVSQCPISLLSEHPVFVEEYLCYVSYGEYSAADSKSAGILQMASEIKSFLGPVHVLVIRFQQYYNPISVARVNRLHIFVPIRAFEIEPRILICAAI
jgi:hypothetical protein